MKPIDREGAISPRDFFYGPSLQQPENYHAIIPEKKENKKPLYKTLSAPINVQVEVTEACNVFCQHCYNYWRKKDNPSSFATLREPQLLQVMDELINNKVFAITLTGGEPMLFKRAVIKAIETCAGHDIPCSLNSNLTMVTNEDAIRLHEAGVAFILTSLISHREDVHDAVTHTPESYKKTLQGIEAVQKAGIQLGVNMVITKLNEDQIYETGKFVASLGIKFFSATKVAPSLSMRDFSEMDVSKETVKNSLEALLRIQEDFGIQIDILRCYPLCLIGDIFRFRKFSRHNCVAGVTTATIGADGGIRPCSHADEVYGNILQEGLSPGWKRMNQWRDGSLIPKECAPCEYLSKCTAGCRMEAKYYGDINDQDPMATYASDVVVDRTSRISTTIFEYDRFGKQKISINPQIRFRSEEFGGIFMVQGKPPTLVNSDASNLILSLKEREEFTSDSVAEALGLSDTNTVNFFNKLMNYGIVRIVEA